MRSKLSVSVLVFFGVQVKRTWAVRSLLWEKTRWRMPMPGL